MYYSVDEDVNVDENEYWTSAANSMPSTSRVQVMPAHGQEDEEIYLSNNMTNSQVVLMDGQDALTLEQQADMMRANKGETSEYCGQNWNVVVTLVLSLQINSSACTCWWRLPLRCDIDKRAARNQMCNTSCQRNRRQGALVCIHFIRKREDFIRITTVL